MKRWKIVALAIVLMSGGAAMAAGLFTNGVPVAGGSQYPTTIPLTGNEQIPADTELTQGQNPASEAITTAQLGGYVWGMPSRGNAIIGGDATTNLWQRGTTGSSVTTTVTYGGPDRFAYWSGTSTAVTVSQVSTAAALAAGYQYAFQMQRTSGQTGVVQVCMAQVVEGVNAYQFQGQTTELDFHAYTGANFSAASPGYNMTAYIITGTGANEGMTKMAFGLNGGGGGSSGWTGQANATAAVISLQGVSTLGRYAAIATIPANATEIGIALCYTPTGTAGTADLIDFAGIQLVRNLTNASLVNATAGYNCANIACTSFERRLQGIETLLQQRYYYQITEGSAGTERGLCRSRSTTTCSWDIKFPVPMFKAPTMTYTAGFAAETTVAGGTLGNCTGLAADTTVSSAIASTGDAYALCTATTIPAAGTVDQMYDNGGSGLVKANAEL